MMPVLFTAADLAVRACEARGRIPGRDPRLRRGGDRLHRAGRRRALRRMAHGNRRCAEGGCRPYTPVEDWAVRLQEGRLHARARSSARTRISPAICAPPSRARGCWMRRSPVDAFPRRAPMARAWSCGATRGSTRAQCRADAAKSSTYLENELARACATRARAGAIRRTLRMSEDKAATLYLPARAAVRALPLGSGPLAAGAEGFPAGTPRPERRVSTRAGDIDLREVLLGEGQQVSRRRRAA